MKENMKDGWIEWHGGEMPMPFGTKIMVRYDSGEVHECLAGDEKSNRWRHTYREGMNDIFAYKILEPITPKLYGAVPDPKGHPNAAILMEIAKEAAINEEYWKEFEYLHGDDWKGFRWKDCDSSIMYSLFMGYQVRRKPRTIRIGSYDVPEPIEIFTSDGDLCVRFNTHLDACAMQKALQELLGAKQ